MTGGRIEDNRPLPPVTRPTRLDEHMVSVGDYVVVELILPGRLAEGHVRAASSEAILLGDVAPAGVRIRWDAIATITPRTTAPTHPAL